VTAPSSPAVVSPAVVANPSTLDDPAASRDQVAKALADAGAPEPAWYETTADDPGRGPTARAVTGGADLVLALGGDGTVRACAAALADTGVPLAILPTGTGNLLARNLDLPLDLAAAVGVAVHGQRHAVDVAELDGEPFVVMAGCGFDARMLDETNDDLKASVGWAAYVQAGLRTLRRAPVVDVEVELDGRRRRARSVGVLVGNVGRLTGGVALLPDARPDDGRLDVAVLTPDGLLAWAGLAVRVLLRRTPKPRHLQVETAQQVVLRWANAVPVEVDGDALPGWRVEVAFDVRPGALLVCVDPQRADR
jgi:YegS/Rv2252/BmrU family lipid kinase